MNYAIVKVGGKQYKVCEKDIIISEKINGKPKEKIVLDKVLLLKLDKKTLIGQPFVAKAKVKAEIIGNIKEKKIRVVKFKAKSRYRKVVGHRQKKTKIKILKIHCPN